MAKEKTENRKPYEVLIEKGSEGIERRIKDCVNQGHFELVGPVCFAGGQYTATMKNTAYVPPVPDPTE